MRQTAVPMVNISLELLNPLSTGSVNHPERQLISDRRVDDGFLPNPADLENMKSAVSVYIPRPLDQLNICTVPLALF